MALELLRMGSQASLASPLKLDSDSRVQVGPASPRTRESKLTALLQTDMDIAGILKNIGISGMINIGKKPIWAHPLLVHGLLAA